MATLEQEDLTIGERLLIARRRQGESQEAAGRRYGMHRNFYGRVERDADRAPAAVTPPELGILTEDERCLILRRRAGRTQEDCAQEIGVTRFWFNQMETGRVSSETLARFWEARA